VDKNRANGPRRTYRPQHTTVPKIKEALNFMKNHSLEVPFIATYRREYVEPELNVHDLWKILHLDEKVRCGRSRKIVLFVLIGIVKNKILERKS